MRIIVLFLVGFILDVLATLDMIAVYNKNAFGSGLLSLIITVFSMGIIVDISINKSNKTTKWIEIMTYALGGAIGAYLTIWWNK